MAEVNQSPVATKTNRLLAVDLLRGLTLAFMIMVNDNGDGQHAYWAMKHADWNGFTPTDLVFPTFLFLVGITTVMSTAARLAKGATKASLFVHALWRAVLLFLLGLLVNSFPHFNPHTLRFYGVLPRIAVCYLAVATLYLISADWRSKAVLAVTALVAYWALMRFVPVPGFGVPTHDIPLLDRDANLAAWIDSAIFPASHLYEKTRDPEGLLSTLPALATALFGMLTGEWLRTTRTVMEKAKGIAIAGAIGLLLGGVWSLWFPINKKLWTSSYVLYAAGWSLLLLALSMWVVELRERKSDAKAQPWWYTVLLVFGMNAIASYVLSELLAGAIGSMHPAPGMNAGMWADQAILGVIPDAAFASLIFSLLYTSTCWVAMWMLYRRRIFLKI